MIEQNILIEIEDNGKRIDQLLTQKMPDMSRAYIQKIIAGAGVCVNQKAVSKSFKVQTGDDVRIEVPDPVASEIQPERLPIKIVYQDKDIAVISKPPAMSAHPSSSERDGTLVNALLYHLKDLSGIGGIERPGIVHRLDKDTSGLMVIAKNDLAHQAFSDSLKAKEVTKIYLALVSGGPEENEGMIDMPIGRSTSHRKKMGVTPGGKYAITRFKVLERFELATLLEVSIETGRTHQIRVHLQKIGHPILGDKLYLSERQINSLRDEVLARGMKYPTRQFLHAHELTFIHPTTGEEMSFKDELPEDLQVVLQSFRAKNKLY